MKRSKRLPVLLLATNDPDTDQLIHTLKTVGFQVHHTRTGAQVLSLYQRYQPSIVVLEMDLPEIDGLSLCHDIHEHNPMVPVVMIIPQPDANLIDKALAGGADDCISYPVHPALLSKRLNLLLQTGLARFTGQHEIQTYLQEGMFVCAPDGQFIRLNDPLLTLLDYPHSEILKLSYLDIVPPIERNELRATVEKLQAHQVFTSEINFITRFNMMIPVQLTMICVEGAMLFGIVRDLRRIHHAEMSWRSAEERYRHFFNAVNDAILIVDMDSGQLLDVNTNAVQWLGYTRPELLLMRFAHLQASLEHQSAQGHNGESDTLLAQSGQVIFQIGLRKKNGEILPVELSSRIVNFEGRQAIINLARDITERLKVEQQEREHRLLAETLRETTAALNTSLDRKEVLDRILTSVEMVVPADSINVMVIEGEEAVAIGRRNRLLTLPTNENRTPRLRIKEAATLRWIFENRKPLIIDDVREFDGWVSTTKESWLRSYVGLPILQDDEVIGFVNLDGSRVGQFTSQQIVYLQAFADQAAIALRNAKLHESVRERADELERYVSERTAELQQERNRLKTILDNLPDEIYVKDRDGRFLLTNNTMMKRIKARFDVDSLEGLTDADLVSLSRAKEWRDEEERIMSTGKPNVNIEVVSIDKTGRKIHLLTTKAPILDESGEVTGIVGINHDITELREAEASLNHVLSSANCLLWEADAFYEKRDYKWEFKVSNEAAAHRFFPLDMQENETYTQAFRRCIPHEDFVRVDQTTKAALRNNYTQYSDEFRVRHAGGELRWMRHDVRITMLSEGQWSLAAVCVDISEQKWTMEALQAIRAQLEQRVEDRTQALSQTNEELTQEIYRRFLTEKALRESEARFRALVDHAPEAIVVFDAESEQFIDVNQNAVKLFGIPRDELMKMKYVEMSPDKQPDGAISRRVMYRKIRGAVKGNKEIFEWMHRSADGVLIPCEVRLLLLPTSNANLIRGSITDITDRKKAEAALLASEAKYRSLTNQLPIGVYRSTRDGALLYANDAIAKLMGFDSGKAMEGETVLQFYSSPEERENLFLSYDQKQGAPQEDEYTLITRDKRRILVRDTWHVIYDDQGNVDYIDGTLLDITEQSRIRHMEQEQRVFAEALSAAASDLNSSLEFDVVLDRILMHIQSVLPPFEGVSIMLLEELKTVHVIRYQQVENGVLIDKVPLFTPLDIDSITNLKNMRDTGKPIVISDTHDSDLWVKQDDLSSWIRSYVAAPITSDGRVIGFLNVSSGTPNQFAHVHATRLQAFATQVGIAIQNARLYAAAQSHAHELQRRVEVRTAELSRQSSQLNAILDGMAEGVIYYDASYKPIYTNRYLSTLTGYDESELREHNLMETLTLLDEGVTFETFQQGINQVLLKAGMWQGIVRMRNRNGNVFDSSWTLNMIRDDSGLPTGSVSVIRDISKERQLERQRSNFIAQASHELRTPLANVKMRLYLLRKQPEKLNDHLEILESVTERMRYLVEDLLDISKSEHGMTVTRRSTVMIQTIIHDVVKLQRPLAGEKRIAIVENLPSKPIYVSVDIYRIERMFINLLMNAINYTHEGGLVKFEIDQRDDRVCVLVHDNGAGIAADVLPHVFKPFVRGSSNKAGTGLGLSIVKEIVESHGGSIEVESEVGVGTTFSVWLNVVSPGGESQE